MKTKKPTPSNKSNPQEPAGDGPGKEKKRKSAGFIETSGFKPNWLETGPLTPDMLPDSPRTEDNLLTVDEFEALQASLQRFYAQTEEETPVEDSAALSTLEVALPADELVLEPSQTTEGPAVAASISRPPADEPSVELSSTRIEEEAGTPAIHPRALDEADAWVEPLLAAIPEPANALVGPAPFAPDRGDARDDEFVVDMVEEDAPAAGEPLTEPVGSLMAPAAPEIDEPAVDVLGAVDDIDDDTTSDEWAAESVAGMGLPVEAPAPSRRRARTPRVRRRPDRLSLGMFLASLLLLALAAFIYFVNPFSRLALGAASLARPVSSPDIAPPRAASGEWCLRAGFLDGSAPAPRLRDSGEAGDILASDRVFSLDYVVPAAGTYEWRVADCADERVAYPEDAAWVSTATANQPVTFIFDSNERADRLFFPIPFVVSAVDDTENYRVVGSFQDWMPDDRSGQLERINVGLYQQVRKIARAGNYEAYVIAGDNDLAIDAYGRTTKPIPFSFQTDRNGDYVIFLVDTDRGRASVLYDMPPILTSLAYGNGYLLLSIALAGLAGLLLLGLLIRLLVMRNSRLYMESGCPNCGQQELMRIARRSSDRLLHLFGIPVYRYRCRNCTWEGKRLSESGTSVSPGVTIAPINGR